MYSYHEIGEGALKEGQELKKHIAWEKEGIRVNNNSKIMNKGCIKFWGK